MTKNNGHVPRPRITVQISIGFTTAQEEALKRITADEHTSIARIVRIALDEYLRRHYPALFN